MNLWPMPVVEALLQTLRALGRRLHQAWQAGATRVGAFTGLAGRRRWASQVRPRLDALYTWLDGGLFKWVVSYTASPLHILALMAVWVGLLVGGAWSAWELVGGNYTNGLSALATSILLYRQLRAELRQALAHRELHNRHDDHDTHLATQDSQLEAIQDLLSRLLAAQEGKEPATPADGAPKP